MLPNESANTTGYVPNDLSSDLSPNTTGTYIQNESSAGSEPGVPVMEPRTISRQITILKRKGTGR